LETREYMKEVRRARLRVEALMERRERCAEMARSRTQRTSKALEQLQRELDSSIETLATQTLEAERHINTLENEGQRDVLRYRYLNGWDWRSIAQRIYPWQARPQGGAAHGRQARPRREADPGRGHEAGERGGTGGCFPDREMAWSAT